MPEATKEISDAIGLVENGNEGAEPSVYEVGYHLLPTVSEEELSKVVAGVTDALKKEQADFIGERFPSKILLAYPIPKRINERRTFFNAAYFGWIAFSIPREALARVKGFLDANPSILRYLIVKTSRNAVQAAMTGAVAIPTGDIGKPKRAEEGSGSFSEEALEEALETIAKEDSKTNE